MSRSSCLGLLYSYKILNYKKLISVFALVAGYVAYRLIQGMIDKCLKLACGMSRVKPLDEWFLFEREGVPNTTGGVIEFHKFKFEDFKYWVRHSFAEKFPAGKTKHRQILGNFYHQKMSDAEFDSKFDKMVWKVDGVHNLEQLG